jgi:hypothetical protein
MQMSFKDALGILDQASKDFKGTRVQHEMIAAAVKQLAPIVEQADVDAAKAKAEADMKTLA